MLPERSPARFVQEKTGLFELANGGTLFLDEITEIDIYLQSKLLRALQSHEIMRIGDNKIIPINVRVISATNKGPLAEVNAGHFRADLFYRLNVLDLKIPSLHERRQDITYLFDHCLHRSSGSGSTAVSVSPSPKFKEVLEHYAWPGNVRELENIVEKYIALQGVLDPHAAEQIILKSLNDGPITDASEPGGESLDDIIKTAVMRTYHNEGENISKTAERLRVDRNTVKRWMKKNQSEQ